MAMEPEVLLLDEPTSALDPEMVKEVLDVIKGLANTGITMVLVTHEMGFARDVSDVIHFMDEGYLIESAPPQEFLRTPKRNARVNFIHHFIVRQLMKILIINPDYGMTQEEMALRCRILEEYTAPDTQLAMVCPQSSGVELNSALDVVLAAPEIVQLAADGQNAGFDAVVLYCFSDPVIDACREALRIPVIGGAQASCLAALNVCRSFGVILADEARLPEKNCSCVRLA